jgi:transposase
VKKQVYPSDLTDSQWHHIRELFEKKNSFGRPRELEMRQVINAVLYILATGCQWRYLPKEFPKWQSVYYYFRKFERDETWARIHDRLRGEGRRKAGRHKHPTAGALDSQSVKTVGVSSCFGYDAGKKVKGSQAAYSGGYVRLVAGRGGDGCRCSRPRRSQTFMRKTVGQLQETAQDLGGRRLSRRVARLGEG